MAAPTRLNGYLLVSVSACLWGTASIASRFVFEDGAADPKLIAFYRLALAAAILLPFALVTQGRSSLRIARPDVFPFAILAVSIAGYQWAFLTSVEAIGVILPNLLALCSAPFIVSLLSSWVLKEPLERMTLVCATFAMAGVVLLVGWPTDIEVSGPVLWTGIALASLAALGFAGVALSSWVLAPRYHPFSLISLAFGIGAILLFPVGLMSGIADVANWQSWASIGFVGLVSTALAYFLFFHGLQSIPAQATGVLVLMEPLTSSVLATLLLGERIGSIGLIGAGLLLGSTVCLAVGGVRGRT